MTGRRVAWVTVALLVTGCVPPWWRMPPLDPTLTLAAHRESRGVVFDRLAPDGAAELVPSGSPWDPATRLEQAHVPVAIIACRGSRATVQSARSPSTTLGAVDAEWDQGAIRFVLRPITGVVRTSVFHRIGGGDPPVLRRFARTVFDLRGDYRADVQDPTGSLVGWIRVRIGRYQPYPRIYDGVVPPFVDGALVAAMVQMLDAEISHIDDRILSDVYMGLN